MLDKASLTKENVKYIIDAFSHFFPEGTIYSSDKPYTSGEFNWNNRESFIDFIFRLTGVKISSDKDIEHIKKAQLAVIKLAEGETQKVEANIPGEETREAQEKERAAREESIKKAREESREAVQTAIKKQQEIYEKLKGKKIVVIPTQQPTQVTLTPNEKEKLFNLAQAIKKDPATVQKLLEQKIQESVEKSPEEIKKNIPEAFIIKTSSEIVEKIKPFGTYQKPEDIPDNFLAINPVSPIVAVTNPESPKLKEIIPDDEVRISFSQNAKALAYSLDSERAINSTLATPLFEGTNNIIPLLYPKEVTEFEIAENQNDKNNKDQGMEVSIEDVYNQGRRVWDIWQKISNKTATVEEIISSSIIVPPPYLAPTSSVAIAEATSFTTAVLPATIGAIAGFESTSLATDWLLRSAPLMLRETSSIPLLIGSGLQSAEITATPALTLTKGTSLILQKGNSAVLVAKGITSSGKTLLAAGIKIGKSSLLVANTTTGIRVAASGVFAKIGAFLGSVGPVIGTIIGAVVGWVAGKIIEKIPWKKIGPWILGALIGGVVWAMAGPVVGVTAAVGTYLITSGITVGTSATLATISSGFGRFLSYFAITIGTPILITLLAFPVVVALILFIINSGAYVVPPTTSTINSIYSGTQSPYIDVQKTISPSGPFQNSQLPLTIEYTVQITAKKGTLTNISIDDKCQVIKNGSSPNCPDPDKKIGSDIPIPDIISPSSPFIFKYKRVYNSSDFKDSLTTDTVTVTADETEQAGAKASGSASVIIGSPPTSCFVFDNSWNASDKARETLAITKITRATTYVSTLCSNKAGPIILHRVGNGGGCGGGGGEVTGSTINIYDAGVNCNDFVTYYTLAHETGHIYSMRTNKYQLFLDSGAMSEGMICTYPNALQPSEDFAEMIALYYTKVAGSTKASCMSGTLQTAYPLHWSFARNNIFMENLDW